MGPGAPNPVGALLALFGLLMLVLVVGGFWHLVARSCRLAGFSPFKRHTIGAIAGLVTAAAFVGLVGDLHRAGFGDVASMLLPVAVVTGLWLLLLRRVRHEARRMRAAQAKAECTPTAPSSKVEQIPPPAVSSGGQ